MLKSAPDSLSPIKDRPETVSSDKYARPVLVLLLRLAFVDKNPTALRFRMQSILHVQNPCNYLLRYQQGYSSLSLLVNERFLLQRMVEKILDFDTIDKRKFSAIMISIPDWLLNSAPDSFGILVNSNDC